MNILITGGAGFIGTHLTHRLLQEGCQVTVFDNFNPQIHGINRQLAPLLRNHVRLIDGDVRNSEIWAQALEQQEVVIHLAAETGTGQSMYQVAHYSDVNVQGTALFIDRIINAPTRSLSQVNKILVASSRAIYGEGKYACLIHGVVYPSMRCIEDLQAGFFEPRCPFCNVACTSLPTDETAPLQPSSFYGLTKQMQEQMVLLFARTLGVSAFALRYQNVYGPGQSLQNPYTGILAIFSNLARNNQLINVFEDGEESRDFVYIDDVVEATWRCLQPDITGLEAVNVGSGQRTSVRCVVEEIIAFFNSKSEVQVTGAFRLGDIRHNHADLTKITQRLGFVPRWTFTEGVKAFLTWATEQTVTTNNYEQSLSELRERKLLDISRQPLKQ